MLSNLLETLQQIIHKAIDMAYDTSFGYLIQCQTTKTNIHLYKIRREKTLQFKWDYLMCGWILLNITLKNPRMYSFI